MEAIARQLGEYLQQNEQDRVFLLLDRQLRLAFPEDWEPFANAQRQSIELEHPAFDEAQLPQLVLMEPRNVPLLQASVHAAALEQQNPQRESLEGFTIGGWLLCPGAVDQKQLAAHLRGCIQFARWRTEEAPSIVRWHDRRVMEWMWPALSPAQQGQLLGIVKDWICLDRRQQLHHYQADSTSSPVSPVRLTSEQLERACNCEDAQDLIRGWQRFQPVLPHDYREQVSRIEAALNRAGLESKQDRVLLGAYALQVHPEVPSHPRVRQAIEQSVRDGAALSEELKLIEDPAGWDEIRSDLLGGAGAGARLKTEEFQHG